MKRWTPPVQTSRKEQLLLKRLTRTKKLFAFLRLHRHELFDDEFQAELEGMYRSTGAGCEPLPPALLCMVSLLQAYTDTSDAEAVELTVVDARWQMVLDCMNAESPLVSQGSLPAFRARLIHAGLDRRLLERTVELAKRTKEFDWKKLPKELRVAVDSRPFEGAGRVEDTINLLGHAARKIVHLAAKLTKLPVETIAEQARVPLALCGSTKAAPILACAVTPANRPEQEATPQLQADLLNRGRSSNSSTSIAGTSTALWWMARTHRAQRSSASPGKYAVANRTSSRRPTSSSTCAAASSRVRPGRRSPSNPVTSSSSTLMSAGRARFALNARTRSTARAAQSASQKMSDCKRSSESFSPLRPAALSCANASASNIDSLTSRLDKADAHATSAYARTSSICAGLRQYKTSRPFIAASWQHDYDFNMFGALECDSRRQRIITRSEQLKAFPGAAQRWPTLCSRSGIQGNDSRAAIRWVL